MSFLREKSVILFRYTSDYYGCFGNFSPHPITDKNGKLWGTSEALYQSYKFDDPKIWEEIRLARGPYEAKKISRKYNNSVRKDWDDVKVGIMKDVLRQKLLAHKEIYLKLWETGKSRICGISAKDTFWEVSPLGIGQNILGKLWMELRDEYIGS